MESGVKVDVVVMEEPPPWFSVDLPNPTTDDIEVRICAGNSDEDTPIGLLELYIQWSPHIQWSPQW